MSLSAPKIDQRTFQELLQQARASAPFYTPEWPAQQEREPGMALLKIFLHLHEQIIARLNQAPDKNLVAFLDMLGMKLEPAQSALAPITFTLAEGTKENIEIPAGTQLAGAGLKPDGESVEVIFVTQDGLSVSPAVLKEVFSIDAGKDLIFKHSEAFTTSQPFQLFQGDNQQEHSLYLAHEDLFNQKKPSRIIVTFDIASGASGGQELEFVWEYSNEGQWVTLANVSREDGTDETNSFQKNGAMILNKEQTGEIQEVEVAGEKKRWIRCRMKTPLSSGAPVELPEVNTIRLGVNPIEPFLPDLAFNNDIPLQVNEVIAMMLAKEAPRPDNEADEEEPLEFACGSPPFESLAPGATEVLLSGYGSHQIKVGDVLEFDSILNDPEWVEVIDPVEALSDQCVRVKFETKLQREYKSGSKVRMVTAISKTQDETSGPIDVLVDGLFDISRGTKVMLPNDPNPVALYVDEDSTKFPKPKEKPPGAAEEPRDKTKLTLRGKEAFKLSESLLEKEEITILPQIKPFGELPRLFDAFYIASDEAYSKKGARITLEVEAEWQGYPSSPPEPKPNPVLSWEYWNGKGWRGLRVADTTEKFFNAGQVSFLCPDDIVKVEVNGEEKFWIRARIIDGDYGKEIEVLLPSGTEARVVKGNVYYPVISKLKITYEDIKREPQLCVAFNNLIHADRTEECNNPEKTFKPFVLLDEQNSGLFLGFNAALIGGPLRLLFSVAEQALPDETQLKMQWSYWNGAKWTALNVVDESEHLTKIGVLEWLGNRDFQKQKFLGQELFWMKGSIVQGSHPQPPTLKRIFPNTTYAFQAAVVEDEVLGSSAGTANQTFALLHTPVIFQEGPPEISPEVWVREPNPPSEAELKILRDELGANVLELKRDEKGELQEVWVRWHAVEDFDDSGPRHRHFTIEERLGRIQFGDGEKGMIPPRGADNLVASYKFGGGVIGNVLSGAINGLKNAIPFVKEVANPLDADGGAETQTLEQVLASGPPRLKHRGRAVTAEDYEWLAQSISRKVARAKCLPNINENGDFDPGWVTVLIVPETKADKPEPTRQLIKVIAEGLAQAGANTVAAPDAVRNHIHVRGPDYVEIVVEATIIPKTINEATAAEQNLRAALKRHVHPLTGGPAKNGWEFGETICRSDIIALVEDIPEIDFVEKMDFYANGEKHEQDIRLERYTLPYSGEPRLGVKLREAQEASSNKGVKSDCA